MEKVLPVDRNDYGTGDFFVAGSAYIGYGR
jgi:hypothetical protein